MYHAQANGQVDRFNHVLKSCILLAILEQRSLKNTVTVYLGIYGATPHVLLDTLWQCFCMAST